MGDLWADFMANQDEVIDKWRHYFPAYERHFAPWRDRSMVFLEIGVSKGGSLRLWQRYFGPYATIVGIDIDAKCRQFESPSVHVRIGNQADTGFLGSVIDEFGVPDVVLDDGSHRMDDLIASFEFLYPRMRSNSVYVVEDLHTGFLEEYGGGPKSPNNFLNYCHNVVMYMNRHWARIPEAHNPIWDDTRSVAFYDSLVCIEKGQPPNLVADQVGRMRTAGFLGRRITRAHTVVR
jgi:hypothetical protein